jgi:6-phosphogluconolactonase
MSLTRRSLLMAALAPQPASLRVYIGSNTNATTKGISVARFDTSSGALSELELAVEAAQPTFFAIHPSGRFLYAIHEINNFEGKRAGALGAYAIDRSSRQLTLLNRLTTQGSGPCHVSLDKHGKMAMVANYGSGSVASYSIGADGQLAGPVSFAQHEGNGPDAKRQPHPFAHSINPTPDNKYAVVCDLGIDQVVVYAINPAKGEMKAHSVCHLAPGCGPRHFAWHPKLPCGYVANELNSTVTVVSYSDGQLDEIHSVATAPEGLSMRNYPAEVCVHPNGRWVYVSNRGEDTIATFAVDKQSGKLSRVTNVSTEGAWPRNFYLVPGGRWMLVANQNSGSVRVFSIDEKTGVPRSTGQGLSVGSPVCLRSVSS